MLKKTDTVTALSLKIKQTIIRLPDACTALIVGKKASETGAIMMARNEDYGVNNWAKYSCIRPRISYFPHDMLNFKNGLSVPAPQISMSYTAMPDWNSTAEYSEDGPFDAFGVNEANVAVSATTSTGSNDKVQALDPFDPRGIVESVIPSLLLPEAKTAREAVCLLGRYVSEYGAGEGNGIIMADPNEVWLFEIGSAHHWMAVRIPDDVYVVLANRLRIHEVNLDDADNVMASAGLFDFVCEHQLLRNPDKTCFDFATAFGLSADEGFYNVDREWYAMHLFSPLSQIPPRQDVCPLLMRPDKLISVSDIAQYMGDDQYKNTPIAHDFTREVGVERQLETHILQLRSDLPHEFMALNYQSFGAIKDSFLMPQYLGSVTQWPKAYQKGSDYYQADSAWWAFRLLSSLIHLNPEKYRPLIHQERDAFFEKALKKQKNLDQELTDIYQTDPQAAIKCADDFTFKMAKKALKKARKLISVILTDVTKSTEKEYTAEEWARIQKL